MAAIELRGMKVVNAVKEALSARAEELSSSFARPRLAIVRIGDRPDDEAYLRGAIKRCESVGIACDLNAFEKSIKNADFLDAFKLINDDPSIHAILVMAPLPEGIDFGAVKNMINPAKDVDCMSPSNMARLFSGDASAHAPCTPAAVMEILKFNDIPISGSRVTIVGRSLVVGKPLAMLLLAENATLTICHTRTRDLADECRRADILIAAAGKAEMIGAGCIKPGAVVIDVGINVKEDGALCGDVKYAEAAEVAGYITPAPGGVGTVTTTMLARNTLDACEMMKRDGK